ncbi:MAG: bifunctional oligoribonuclease/PAP phosphatase NrnA [Epsilonproteobacteria bacterium]|nr:bifunctional oligoribonuclease/PAP phosphatase NrnA [Campylobacterota bacterium]NPA64130.1 bifunctional oligoribonuclease/PAP phosphatase NrnA [Campylobacterota bacterium]
MSEAAKLIQKADRIVLLTHIDPDADTLGSALGFYHVLKRMGKRVYVVNTTKIPYNLDFLPGISKIKKELPQKCDLMISFDCSSPDRLGVELAEVSLINFDHHKSNTLFGDINIVDPQAVATASVVFRFMEEAGYFVPKESALCLYTALADDSGFFRYERVDERTFSQAARLCALGADAEYVARMLTMREPLAKMRLMAQLLETLELRLDGQVGVIRLTQDMLRHTGATKEMADEALDMVRRLATVEVALLLRQEEDGRIKVSMRSKERVDVGKVAVEFGGGGHERAAGFTAFEKDFDTLLERLLQRLKEELGVEA